MGKSSPALWAGIALRELVMLVTELQERHAWA